jgi:methyl-accepting chemotaxis protein
MINKNMKIYQKFIVAFSLLTIIVWTLGLVVLYTFQQMDEQVTALNNDIIPGAFSMLETKAALSTLSNEVTEFVVTGKPEHREHVDETIALIKHNVETHAKHEIHIGEQEHQVALQMANRAKEIISLAKQILELTESKGIKTEIKALQRQLHLKREELVVVLMKHVKIHNEELKNARLELENIRSQGIYSVLIAILIVMLSLIGIGWVLSRTISKPLKYMIEVFHAIATGHLDNDIRVTRKDEIGQLLRAFNNMQAQLRERIQEDKRIAEEALRINEALDNVTTSVLIADTQAKIIYANQAAQQLFTQAERVIRKEVPHFQANNLLGLSIDTFLANITPTKIHHTLVTLGDLQLEVNIIPVINAEGQRLGLVSELRDCTTEIATEQEVNAVVSAASRGDLSQRIGLDDKTNFFQTFSQGLNQTLDNFEQMIKELQQVFAALAKGNLQKTIVGDYTGSLEQLKNDVNATINKLTFIMDGIQKAAESASQGDFSQCINLHNQEGFFALLSEQLNQILESNQQMVKELMQVFAAVANGDLTQTITRDYVGILQQLKNDVNATVMNLTEIINTVQKSADIVAQAVAETSQGNSNLSQRTEQQAASLEQTVASMEEMTGTVQQNADNAQQAERLATSARNYAQTGGDVIEAAIVAMREIHQSSNKVADIISVIDEIAFQTNLLALNAAVEAARAGEQGRGFAVVATEVRNLAQRSAAAAKEIKSLIQDSVEKVDEGTRLVNQSGDTLKEIVLAAKKVSDIISEIAAASQEQNAGIQQMNKVVLQMDQMTQQNSALVEEATVTSETLKDQAKSLKEKVDFFNTGTEAHSVVNFQTQIPTSKLPSNRNLNHPVSQLSRKIHEVDDEWKDF